MSLSLNRWRAKVSVVTGADSGIGASIAEQLVEEGLQVVGVDINSEHMQELSEKLSGKPGKLHIMKTDVRNEEDVIKAFAWIESNLGPVHILINSAGVLKTGGLVDGDSKKWKEVLDTNVLGLCVTTREAVKSMRAHNIDGHIVHLNSICGQKSVTFPGLNLYPASKHAVTALTETLRQELNQIGTKIKVTSISPGLVDTPMVEVDNIAEMGKKVVTDRPSLAVLQVEDVTEAVLYVLSTPPHVQIHELVIKPIGEKD